MDKADLNKIKKLLSQTTAYRISKDTGIGETTISRWVTGKTPLTKMSLDHAIRLTEYYDTTKKGENVMKHTEQEILELIEEYELEPHMVDIWEDKDGALLLEERGMRPVEGVEWIAYVDNGSVVFR